MSPQQSCRMKDEGYKQKGASLIMMLYVLSLSIFLIIFGVKILPIYIENYFVTKTLSTIKDNYEEGQHNFSEGMQGDIRNKIERYFQMNNVNRVSLSNLTFTNNGSFLDVRLKYDVQTPFIGNIDAVIHFDDTVKIKSQ